MSGVYFRKAKLLKIRKYKAHTGKELSIPNTIELMKPRELRFDSGICSQGSYCEKYCIEWCIPNDFVDGWCLGKCISRKQLFSTAKLWKYIISDYFYGER